MPPVIRSARTFSRDIVQVIAAVERGEIDAFVLPTPQGERIFTSSTNEQHYQVLIEEMSEGALTLSGSGTIVYCNSAFARIVGCQLEKVIGAFFSDLVVAADAGKLKELLAQGCLTSARTELALRGAGGLEVPVYVSFQPLRGADCSRICAVVTDLTEFVEARQAQLRLAAIVENSADAILSTTPEGTILSWNRGAEHLLGYCADEVIGKSILSTIPVDRCESFLRLWERVQSGESIENFELLQLHKNGTRIDAALTLSPIRDRQGRVIAASAIARDNTSRRKAQRRLQSVLESAPDSIVVVNHNGIIVFVNTQAEILFGYLRDEIVGQHLALLFPSCLQDFFGDWLQQDSRARLPGRRHEVSALRADGTEFPSEISLGPVESDEGTLLCGSVRDVSERHGLQRALREKNAQLQAALNTKEHFLSTMSHELRTPLTAIIGYTGILLMKIPGPLNDEQIRQLELVRSSARHLLSIISDLLDLARIEAGNAEVQREQVSCLEVVKQTLHELGPAQVEKGLELRLEEPPGPVTLFTNHCFFRQILTNLVSNAIKYTDQGFIRISCRQHGESMVSVTVTDTGIGIRQEDLSRLFVQFCRIRSESSPSREGVGLGLHLSQKLAILLGGRITVESVFGQGSSFTLTLPVGQSQD
jgi:PAS domain S-box-containing protein